MDSIKNELLSKMQAAGRSNEITYKFKIANTDELRVAIALSTLGMFDIIPRAECRMKNSKISTELRNKANRIFISCKNNSEELLQAWELYSKSIAIAPNTSQELPLAYANRSALLMKLHKYTESIEDINRALNLDYPKHLKRKILWRKIECLKLLTATEKLKDTDIDETWFKNLNLKNEDDDEEKLEDRLKIVESSRFATLLTKTELTKDLPSFKPHSNIPCASEALTVKYDHNFGRHVVTNRKVNPGEVLVIEKPYATILKSEEIYTHCSNCLQVHWAMIPCEHCIYAMYCSEKCKNNAWNQYHQVECPVTGYLLDLDYNKCSLFSMRLAILALKDAKTVNNLKNYLNQLESLRGSPVKDTADGYSSNEYYNVYSLITNEEKRSISDLFERAMNAAFIIYYLCLLTKFFGKKFEPVLQEIAMDPDIVFIGGLILRHMQIIPSNIHSYEEERKLETIDIGASALPFCSLINHSCDPNVSRCSTKERMIIFSIVPIEKGQQIFDCYGSHYAIMNKLQRDEKLRQYYFACACRACKEDWPTYENLSSFNKLLDDKKVKRKVEEALQKFDTYVDCATRDDIDDKPFLIRDLSRMIEILICFVPLPCCEVNNVVETLKRVYALTYGNKFEFPKTV